MCDFTHLHLHTEYSMLDGSIRIPQLMERVKEYGMPAVAMTDHGVMNGVSEFWMAARDHGLKPILGCEAYVAPDKRDIRKEINGIKYYHLLLLAQNLTGYQNLIRLVSMGHMEGMYYKPRIDRELLQKHSEGIICTSACLGGPLARHLIRKEDDKALDWLKFFKEQFPDRFYLELQRNGFAGSDEFSKEYEQKYDQETVRMIKEQMYVNQRLKEWGQEYDLPVVATTDAHFMDAEDKEVQKVLFCISDGLSINDPKAREGYVGTYLADQEEMKERFSDDKEPLANTMRIAEQVEEYDITYDRIQPRYWNMPENTTAKDELYKQTMEGAKEKYGEITKELQERIDYELEVIHNKGYDDYFLVVSDLMKWSARNDILTGVRGSVAGSVVAHCMDIVEVDPIKWELYFERFLNPERPSPPDIDIDIQDSRRDEVVDYTREKYGNENVVSICAIGRLKTKAAIRDVARVIGVDLEVADKLSKMVNVVFGKVFTIDKQMETDPEFKRIIESDPQLMKLAGYVRKIEGLSRHMSVHACGYLITPDPVIDYVPVQKESGGDKIITQMEFMWIEEAGLMKFDFLGLRTLTIVSNALKNVKQSKGVDIGFYDIPNDDKETFDLFSRGETMGVFQFESPPMRKYLQDLHPETQEDLCFMVAAYRPGPMKYIPDYILRKKGKQETTYLIPEMEPIVNMTYGFAIYQEQVIRIAVDIAGYSMGQADLLRRAMGKKKIKIMKQEEPKFKEGVMKLGYDKEIADQIWEYLLPFADYGFNKAHAAGYAVLAYKCAYLKAHYPLEFMAALMYSDLGDTDRIVTDIEEAKRMGYQVLPPDINKSDVHFTVEGEDVIRFGLGAIKNVGEKVCNKIVQVRAEQGEFNSLDDLITKVGAHNINKKSLECLIMTGTMDQFGSRNQLLAVMPAVLERIAKEGSMAAIGQTDIFGLSTGEVEVTASPLPKVEIENSAQKISWEKDLLGVFVSAHPLDEHFWLPLKNGFTSIDKAQGLKDGDQVKIPVIISSIRRITTKKDGKPMAFLTLEDLTGRCDSVLFPRGFADFQDKLVEAVPFVVTGKVSFRNDTFSIIIDSIKDISSYRRPSKVKIDITGVSDQNDLGRIKECIDSSGELEIQIMYGNRFNPNTLKRRMRLEKQCVQVISKYVI